MSSKSTYMRQLNEADEQELTTTLFYTVDDMERNLAYIQNNLDCSKPLSRARLANLMIMSDSLSSMVARIVVDQSK